MSSQVPEILFVCVHNAGRSQMAAADVTQEFPKPVTDELVCAARCRDHIGCGDACPVHPGKRYLDWHLAVGPLRTTVAILSVRLVFNSCSQSGCVGAKYPS